MHSQIIKIKLAIATIIYEVKQQSSESYYCVNESAGRGDVAQARTRRRLLEEVEADVADDMHKGSCAVWCQKAPEFGTAESVLESVLNAGQTQHSSATFSW